MTQFVGEKGAYFQKNLKKWELSFKPEFIGEGLGC